MKLETNIHTIFLTVGPSNCGKSHFTKNVLLPELKRLDENFNIQYISSDDIRRELLGSTDAHKHDTKMMAVSEQAFSLLYHRVRYVTSYPVNADFVIVDTTGLSEDFRKDIQDIAKKNNYSIEVILFDYKNKDDYFKYVDNDENIDPRVIHKHIKKFREKALPRISKKGFNRVHKFISNDFSDFELDVVDYDFYKSHLLENNDEVEYVIIGDVHGCYDELLDLMRLHNVYLKDTGKLEQVDFDNRKQVKFILTGDIIDKGKDVKKVLKLIFDNQNWFLLVKGNHENFVYKYLNNDIPEPPPQEVIDSYFTCVKEFSEDTESKDLFFTLFNSMRTFYKHDNFIVTHAPCKKKYLGKLDNVSVRNQKSYRYSREEDFKDREEFEEAIKNDFEFIKIEASHIHPYHIFGHVPFQTRYRVGNKFGIDTGCVEGGKLTSIIVNQYGKPFFQQVNSSIEKTRSLITIKKEIPDYLSKIDDNEMKRLHWMARNKVNFVSGTMSPSDKSETELESLESGLKYFEEKGVKEVILQPKYMGSRCQIYLHDDYTKSYAVSRNGYKIKQTDLTDVFGLMRKTKDHLFKKFRNAETIVFDGELMPWSAIGRGLIDRSFLSVNGAIKNETKFLKDNGFEESLDSINSGLIAQFRQDIIKQLPKDEMIKKYSHPVYNTLRNYVEFSKEKLKLKDQEKWIETFSNQLELYGQDLPLEYKPFSLLKVFYKDGKEETFFDRKNEEIYTTVTNDEYFIVDLENENSLDYAQRFYDRIVDSRSMEGVVIKPNDSVYIEGVAPYMKVRNKNYLTIVYGYDYFHDRKFEKLMNQKNISRKLRLSIDEFETGMRLLGFPSDKLTVDNTEYLNLLAKMIFELKSEEGIDPRL